MYLYNVIIKRVRHKCNKSDYNTQIICYIKKKNNVNKGDIINIEVFKLTNKNVTKQLKNK